MSNSFDYLFILMVVFLSCESCISIKISSFLKKGITEQRIWWNKLKKSKDIINLFSFFRNSLFFIAKKVALKR